MPKVRFSKFSVFVMMTNAVPTFDDWGMYRHPIPSRSATATCLKRVDPLVTFKVIGAVAIKEDCAQKPSFYVR